jgi:hypothetical protein
MTMKTMLLVVALVTVIAMPAFAQRAPNSGQRPGSTPPGGIYYYRHGKAHSNFEARDSKHKTSHRKHAASRPVKDPTRQ